MAQGDFRLADKQEVIVLRPELAYRMRPTSTQASRSNAKFWGST